MELNDRKYHNKRHHDESERERGRGMPAWRAPGFQQREERARRADVTCIQLPAWRAPYFQQREGQAHRAGIQKHTHTDTCEREETHRFKPADF